MIYHLYFSVGAVLLCVAVLCVLKYIFISKMRLDSRDSNKKTCMSTVEVLGLIRNLKSLRMLVSFICSSWTSTGHNIKRLESIMPFPVSVHKGWKLHSYQQSSRVWTQEISHNSSSATLNIYGAYSKLRVPAQVIMAILKDVTKTTSWKPGCLATSITYKPPDCDMTASRMKGLLGGGPVQHDIVMEETSLHIPEPSGPWHHILTLLGQNGTLKQTLTKELNRYWNREDNGVCWHLQMCQKKQEWLFFLAQPVEVVDECLLTLIGYRDCDNHHASAPYIAEVLGSLCEYVTYRKLPATPLIEIKLPVARSERTSLRSYSSSDEAGTSGNIPGKGFYLRFRSLVERPFSGAEISTSDKRQLRRSASILQHSSGPVIHSHSSNSVSVNSSPKQTRATAKLKTNSLDRRDMPKLNTPKGSMSAPNVATNTVNEIITDSDTVITETADLEDIEADNAQTESQHKGDDSTENNNEVKQQGSEHTNDCASDDENSNIVGTGSEKDDYEEVKDLDAILDADINDHEKYEQSNEAMLNSTNSKEAIIHIVAANHTAAELLAVALQASNLDLSKSIEEQVVNSGGWMFCGLDSDVVVLKKISIQENIQCYLGKGIIQATPKVVWNAIRNPRTRFTYDDSLKKVDVLSTISESIKVVYYYHEVLQLFRTECCDMVVTQSERVDRGDKHILAMQSTDKTKVPVPDGTVRVKVLPSGWIIEPMTKEKKMFSMVTYIMQIDFGNVRGVNDKSLFEDLISKQPMSIAYLRQYLRPSTYMK